MRKTPDTIAALLPAAIAACGLVGCTTTNIVRTEQIERLDGYEARQVPQPERQLETIDGGNVSYQADSRLYLDVPGYRLGGRFESIRVRDGRFEGRTDDGNQIQASLEQVAGATVVRPSPGKSLVLFGGVLLGVLATSVLLLISQIEPQGGRALRIRGKIVAAPLVLSDGWRKLDIRPDTSSLSPAARAALTTAWAACARSEHASVPAFSRLSLSLVSLGAPARLVEAAHRAALEEIEHARMSFTLAEAYASTPMAPGPLVELAAARAVTVTSRPDLACESLVDGCLLEGAAAAYAQAAHARATDPAVREVLAVIARDEASHTELAWEIVRWGCRRGGVDLGRRLVTLARQQRPPKPPVDAPPHLSSVLEAHGWPAAAVWRDLFDRTRTEVTSRLEREILAVDEQPRSAARGPA